jgi:hypothetical protein
MPKKIQHTTKADLINVPLPNHAATYTVISHQFVIDYAYQSLAAAGFGIVDEEYRCTADGQIAQGIYKLNFNNDPELSMMFAWTNSYNKQVKFKCVVGAYINNSGSVMISGEVGSWVRKHTGAADTETKQTIDDYIANAYMYYTQLCSDKAAMETVSLNKRKQSQLLGVLFAEYEILTTEQASMIRDQMKRPLQVFANSDSLWAFYNFVTNALQSSHPKTWMEDQRILHYFIGTICDFKQCSVPAQVVQPINTVSTPIEDPLASNYGEPENQTNLLVQIAEVTGDDSVLQVQQTGTNEVKNEEVLYQSEEVVEDVVEDIEIPFDIDEDDDAVLGSLLVPIEKPEPPVTVEEYLEQNILMKDEDGLFEEVSIHPAEQEVKECIDDIVVQYTDPSGNVFEAPVVAPCAAHDAETVREIEKEKSEDIFPQINFVIDTVELNETTNMAVIVAENIEDSDTDEFAEADNFDLNFDDDTNEDRDSTPDFF